MLDTGRSNRIEQIGIHFDGGGLTDEVEAEQDRGHAIALFNPPLYTLERASLNLNAHALANGRRQAHSDVRLQGEENILQLPFEGFLIEDLEKVGDVII